MADSRLIRFSVLAGILLLGTSLPGSLPNALAQTQAPIPGQRFVWEPVARIDNPQFPVQIVLINQTGIDLDYGFTDNPEATPQTLAANARTTVTLTDPSILLSINPIQSSGDGGIPLLQFNVQVRSPNAIEVTLTPGGGLDITGDNIGQVLNIQESGGIFVY